MKRTILFISSLWLLSLFGCGNNDSLEVETQVIDGITHILNPAQPLKGRVALEVEKIREIDPYQHEDVSLRSIRFERDDDGEVILYDPDDTEAQRFGPDGTYLGSLITVGQGPGEFPNGRRFHPFYIDGMIIASGARKLAKYSKAGEFLEERKIDHSPIEVFDYKHIFIKERQGDYQNWTYRISLLELLPISSGEDIKTDYFHAENVGMITWQNRGFNDEWGTPDINFCFHSELQKIYVMRNTEYQIHVKNLAGDPLHVIQVPHENIHLSTADKRELLDRILKRESTHWILDHYPDTLVSVNAIKSLPRGHLAAICITGVKKVRIDVFDPRGRYVYVLEPPEGINLDDAEFYDFGFALTETDEDEYQIYREYRIKNLPEIFVK